MWESIRLDYMSSEQQSDNDYIDLHPDKGESFSHYYTHLETSKMIVCFLPKYLLNNDLFCPIITEILSERKNTHLMF